ncbi:MAG: hypothetical protein HRU41_00285 [Saprospiraceae bacterium]|nr:hypothetical protein [Saprospiraceae bacterium]
MKIYSLYFSLLLLLISSCRTAADQLATPLSPAQLAAYKLQPGLITTLELEENCLSFTQDESVVFWTAGNDWEKQLPFLAKKVNGRFTQAQRIVELDTIYNGAISPSGQRILYTVRQGDETSTWLSQRKEGQWLPGINLTEQSGIKAGYFQWYTEKELYLYTPENEGDLARGRFVDEQLEIQLLPAPINTTKGTEFSPFVGPKKQFLIFTRYLEGDLSQQGFFYSHNRGSESEPTWGPPQKIKALPYGWGAYQSRDGRTFYFTDGLDLFAIPFSSLGMKRTR